MKHLYLNLKRFDVLRQYGGVNSLAEPRAWGSTIVKGIQQQLAAHDGFEYVAFLPEAHIIPAVTALDQESVLRIGCQSVFRLDTSIGGYFGAFTSHRSANSMVALGCRDTIIGHCEERAAYAAVLQEAGVTESSSINRLLNQQVRRAVEAGMSVLYCIGEQAEEQEQWQTVLERQLTVGLEGVDRSKVVIAYEPVWSIGPGKTPADKPYITKVARFVKEVTSGLDVVYGGGLNQRNAAMLASIEEIDGGLIALTRFSGAIGFYVDEYVEIVEMYRQGGMA